MGSVIVVLYSQRLWSGGMPYPYDVPGLQPKPQSQWILFGLMGMAAAVTGLLVLIVVLAVAEFF